MGRDGRLRRVIVAVAAAVVLAPAGTAVAHEGGTVDYRWLDGSGPARAAGRSAPLPAGQPTDLWTPDAQAVLSLPAAALAGDPGTAVAADLQPVDAEALGGLPDDLAPAGNAYRVELDLAAPGRILLAAAHPVAAVLHSSDGTSWRALPHDAGVGALVGAPLPAPGYYLVATDDRHGGSPLVPSLVSAAVGGVLLAVGLRRRRVRTSAASGGAAPRRRAGRPART